MRIQLFTPLLIVLLTIPVAGSGQGFLKARGKAIVRENGDTMLLKGMGLGGWMLQEGYMLQTAGFANAQHKIREKIEGLIGPADTDLFYETWLENHVRKIDIDSLKAWGFNSVRLPMHYNLFTLPVEEEPIPGENTWLTKGFELTDSLLSWCRQNEMYVILDLHAAPGGQGRDEGISDYDPAKPSLWESKANRDKSVALWKRIAGKYADEPWIAGYDLINETNWNMEGNVPLRDLYYELTDSIRTVDKKHILFIEGNWFANDFTGLTPPWDDNIVYSPHKYWSINDQASIQWVLDIRDRYNVPIYFGECGENSNTWFRDAIRLFEEHELGWAWWPMKKIESIAGPLSVPKTPQYQALLDYWNGNGSAPTPAFAKAALMTMAENLKLEKCIYQKDVIDAMFRQVRSEKAIPFKTQTIPGIVYATDFDMGPAGVAYWDSELANYQVSTGSYSSWNNGWSYRNDGVDIEATEDQINSNGYNIGWMTTGEWMQYDIDVAESGIYEVQVRVAANGNDGKFHFSAGEADISGLITVPNTGGWQNWQTVTVPDLILTPTDKKLRFNVDQEGFNLNSFKFIKKSETTSIPARYVSAITLDEHTVQLNLNKDLKGPLTSSAAGFQLLVNGNVIPISGVELRMENARIITFSVDHTFRSDDVIRISYSGNQVLARDGTALSSFNQQIVKNTVAIIHRIPGRVEAEDYFFQSGIQLENTTDAGGGQNIGYLDVGDYLDYYIQVAQSGVYNIDYRTAALSETGEIELQLIHADGTATPIHNLSFQPTGGWQSWRTTSKEAKLDAGLQHLRIVIKRPLFNINWFEFSLLTLVKRPELSDGFTLFPNPGAGVFYLKSKEQNEQLLNIQIYNTLGQLIYRKNARIHKASSEELDLTSVPNGHYLLVIHTDTGISYRSLFLKEGDQ